LTVATVAGCGSNAVEAPEPAPPSLVEATRVEPELFSQHIEVVGQLAAEESVVIRSEIAGIIESVDFEEGSDVEKGRVLFVLDSREQRASLRFAEANRVRVADVYQRTLKLSKVRVSAVAELTQAKAAVDAAEAAVELAQIELARTRIRAPFDGAVGARYVSQGDRVDSDTELVQIDAVSDLVLQFSLPESAISLARKGLRVTAQVGARGDVSFRAEVYFVSPTLDPSSRRLSLKARVPNEGRRLRPGMFARVSIEREATRNALLVPESSIAYDARGAYVWRVSSENAAERVSVELGGRLAGRVEVRSGLRAGDTVVISGTHMLYAGVPVEVRALDVALGD